MTLKEIKKNVQLWSGFPLEGETEGELISNIETIGDNLLNEVSDKQSRYEQLIKSLNL
ncbi:hypothetical protein [uncultured Tenacibaculum sp.]|uniref:hypothetical protein n=1 Tax=uncultured Tenacibaculum sp. TaxID=174713 RepID=UPI0026363155|nr:hypothetical protein [uncultured Tenacibaculum sp.]